MASFQFNFLETEEIVAEDLSTSSAESKTSKNSITAFRITPNLCRPIYNFVMCKKSTTSYRHVMSVSGCPFQYITLDELRKLIAEEPDSEDCLELLSLTESQNSDLVPGLYEGGFKVWECTFDLLKFLVNANICFKNCDVLDLGCGAGLLGIHAALDDAASVHFHDYNHQVLSYVTIPNLLSNLAQKKSLQKDEIKHTVTIKHNFFCGDWSDFDSLVSCDHKYDFILTSETIYSVQSQRKLLDVFRKFLAPEGVVFVAAKTHYFGVGGSTLAFSQLISESKLFNYEVIGEEGDGVPRQIIKLTRVNKSKTI